MALFITIIADDLDISQVFFFFWSPPLMIMAKVVLALVVVGLTSCSRPYLFCCPWCPLFFSPL